MSNRLEKSWFAMHCSMAAIEEDLDIDAMEKVDVPEREINALVRSVQQRIEAIRRDTRRAVKERIRRAKLRAR